ncbi:MAG TPA: DUF3857 domain-containing protein, partial [Candidatus Polarisedimenticolia bacterium]|nr:DUF3857 domain-containing protein [Candidatus Polarisedimenticolia bacterium]
EREKGIAPDPSRGMQHGVILAEETITDDSGSLSVLTHHLRAKILGPGGRGLADVVLPFAEPDGKLRRWWGRTILPDGTVLELKQEELKTQEVVRLGGLKLRVLKAALPGVTAGCVIDYGYVIEMGRPESWRYVPLQREWPVLTFRYRWLPSPGRQSKYYVRRRPDLPLEIKREKLAVVLEGRDLPLFVDEPYRPPDDVIRAGAQLYYAPSVALVGTSLGSTLRDRSSDPNEFWHESARNQENWIKLFLKKDEPLRQALDSMDIPPEAPLEEKLGIAYDWIAANIRNVSQLTSEESAEWAAENEERQR